MKRNIYLRVKLKSLAEEARIIRIEEQRANLAGKYSLQNSLREHRSGVVRTASRETLIAYQFLRGIPYEAFERAGSRTVDWKHVYSMVKKYGSGTEDELKVWFSGKLLKAA